MRKIHNVAIYSGKRSLWDSSSLRFVMMSCLNSQKEARDRVIKKNPERKSFWWRIKKEGHPQKPRTFQRKTNFFPLITSNTSH